MKFIDRKTTKTLKISKENYNKSASIVIIAQNIVLLAIFLLILKNLIIFATFTNLITNSYKHANTSLPMRYNLSCGILSRDRKISLVINTYNLVVN